MSTLKISTRTLTFVEALFIMLGSLESPLLACYDCYCFCDLPGYKEMFPYLNCGHYKNREVRIGDYENGGIFLLNAGSVSYDRHPQTN